MFPSFQPHRLFNSRRAFSVMELLIVVAIMAIITSVSLPAITSLLQSSNLAQGGQDLVGEIGKARQFASTRNTTIEVRLIQCSTYGYNAIQLWSASSEQAAATALTRMVYLPSTVVISKDSSYYSQLLSQLSSGQTMTVNGGKTASYVSFCVMPSGQLQLTSANSATETLTMSNLYLTVVPSRYGTTSLEPGSAGSPSNYFTVQINPCTAAVQTYRP